MAKSITNPNILTCKNLTKVFHQTTVLHNINLEIPRGKIVGLLGRNGAGKSTLIKTFNDLITPTSGEVLVAGAKIGPASKKLISYLPERTYLDKTMTIGEAIHFFSEFYDDFDLDRAESLLRILDLKTEMNIAKISKGMQEKLQLTLVMSRQAELYILDEPLGGIDPATRDFILDTILGHLNNGASMLISTHLIADVERILDYVYFIDHGEIILASDADSLRQKYNQSIDDIFRTQFKNHAH